MTALSIIRGAAVKLGIDVPSQVFAVTTRTMVEAQEVLNDTAKMIARHHDWSALKTIATFTGDGSETDFPLPADYARMLKKARVWPSAAPWSSFTHYPDTDRWLGMSVQSFNPTFGGWTIFGGEMHIRPAMANGSTAMFYYITSKIAVDTEGVAKTDFTLDTDRFRLDDQVLKLGFIYRWKQAKGREYAQEMDDYETALAQAVGADKGSNVLTLSTPRWRLGSDAVMAFPGVIVP